ncbi:hypothetical protein LEMLEM_LOCUS21069 [Lemmus lemmus]
MCSSLLQFLGFVDAHRDQPRISRGTPAWSSEIHEILECEEESMLLDRPLTICAKVPGSGWLTAPFISGEHSVSMAQKVAGREMTSP